MILLPEGEVTALWEGLLGWRVLARYWELITACRHLESFEPGTVYIYKCDLLVSVMPHDVRGGSLKSNANETDNEVTYVYVYGPRFKRL